ncbi:hypothetical protein G9P44_001923 [Scheffersomyces stipitis]|nr:hypothetical protein G9P44_001923 [Scheffersomyces stipitis]
MSRIYNDSFVFCSSADAPPDVTAIDFNQVYPLASLHFCPNCQTPKSPIQYSYNIESKFCSNCLADHSVSSASFCSKNCFDCPSCGTILTITISDHNGQGKSFNFKCPYCTFIYKTNVIEIPKSLHTIIRLERNDNPDKKHALFRQIQTRLAEPNKSSKEINQRQLENLSLGKKETEKIDDFDVQESDKDISDIANLENILSSTFPTISSTTKLFPKTHRLSSKVSKKCLACNTILQMPALIPNSPTVYKFSSKFNAVDYLPTLKIADAPTNILKIDEQYNIVLNIINPLQTKMTVSLASPAQLPANCVYPASNSKFTISIPLTKFTIGNAVSKNILKGIPTSILTSNTAVSRSEKSKRIGESALAVDQFDVDKLVQKGANWYSVPIALTIETGSCSDIEHEIKIPLYIKINSDIPDNLLSVSRREKLALGYWNIVTLGKYRIIE